MSLLVKGVQVVDGSGREAYKADVLVQKDIISSIGNLKERGADKVIEGLGNYLTPGFIDVHAQSDHYLSLFVNPEQEDFLKQGVTTILGGAFGASLAPLLYGLPSSVETWSDTRDINVDWHTVDEFLSGLEGRRLGVNFGTLVGHSTVRRDLVGDRRTLDAKELVVLRKVIDQSLSEGAFGVSCDLGSIYGGGASTREVTEVARASWEGNGVCVIGLRDVKKGLAGSVEEAIKIAKASGASVLIENLRPLKGYTKEFREALSMLKEAADMHDIRFLTEPYESREIPIYLFLPASLRKTSLEVALAGVRDSKNKKAIHEELKEIDFRNMKVASAPRHHFLVGKSIKEIADNWDVSYIEAMHRLMNMSDLRATVFYDDAGRPTLRNFFGEERALITSSGTGVNSGGGHLANEEASQAFPGYLRTAVSEGLLSLEEAVMKVSGEPARLFKIGDRGLVKEGMCADLVLLSKDRYEIKQVILGGKVLGEDELRGDVLRHYG